MSLASVAGTARVVNAQSGSPDTDRETAGRRRRVIVETDPVGVPVESQRKRRHMSFTPYDRPVRAAFIGLGRIYDLNMRAYVDNPDVEVVALVDPSEERRAQRQADWPGARTFASAAELAASGLDVDAVEALLPIPLHVDGVDRAARLRLARQPAKADVQRPRRARNGCSTRPKRTTGVLRVMENYLFYEPLRKLKETVESGALGEVSGYHMKMVGSGRGGWDVPASSYRVAGPADASTAAASSCSTTAGTSSRPRSGSSVRSRKCARGSGAPRSCPDSRSTRPPPSCGSTTTGSAACGTSRSRSTCTSAPTTTRTTNGGRSPAAAATPA